MNRADNAIEIFKSNYNCAQSVFASFSDYLNITKDFALRTATGFGGGMGRTQNVCGAVTGGILVLNMIYGRGEDEEKSKQHESYKIVHSFISEFERMHNVLSCKDLLDGCELLTEEGEARFQAENMRELCYSYVRTAVELVEKIISDKNLGE